MCAIKRVKAAEMFPLVQDILKQGGKVWITVTGMSMYPFLKEDRDQVELSEITFEALRRGDIVLIRRRSGVYVLHRVLKKGEKDFYMIGDAQQWVEGPLEPDQLIAVVTKVKRKDRIVECTNWLWKISVMVWLWIIPVRHWVLRGAGILVPAAKRFLKKVYGSRTT